MAFAEMSVIVFSDDDLDSVISEYFPPKRYESLGSFVSYKGKLGCSDPYWERYSNKKIYFSFPIVPIWIEKVVVELNSLYKNVKINLVENISSPNIYGLVGNCSVFTLEYSKEYPYEFKKFSSLMFHHILRLFSYSEYTPYLGGEIF